MRFKSASVIVVGLSLLSSCASVVRGGSQTILITTPPTTGANCVLTNNQGTWSVNSPGTVTVKKSKQNIVVTCTKDGWQDGFAAIPSGFDDVASADALLTGLVGLGIDASTGAINSYPATFQVPMAPLPGTPQASAQ